MPNFELSKQDVANFFTKSNMKKILYDHIMLAENSTSTLELRLHKEVEIFQCDGIDCLVNYVYEPNKVEVDDSRFE